MFKASVSLLLFAPLVTLAEPLAHLQSSGQEQDARQQEEPSVLDEMDQMLGGDPMDELVELFHEVERALVAIDDRLYEAGASGELSSVDSAGLLKLLQSTKDTSSSVVQGIDRILEVASKMNAQQGQGSGSDKPKNSESPLDSERDRGPMQRERTPEAPNQDQGSPEESQEKEASKTKREQQGSDPKDRGESQDRGENTKGSPSKDASGQPMPRAEDADRWGELPQRVRDTFRSQGRDGLPAQYRDWIDAYYKRLNRARS